MARLYANENFRLPVVERLRALGHDVATVAETGNAGQAWPDEAVLNWALQESRVLLTFNRKHFLRLHTASSAHAGIIASTVHADFGALATRIHDALCGRTSLAGQFVRVNRPS